ncbi:GntR family transcriptional regulator [Alsobacter sp. R-9]
MRPGQARFDIRIGVESMLARRAIEKAGPDDVATLAAIHARFVDEIHARSAAASETNFLFHATLYALAGNPKAEQLLEGRTQVVRTSGVGLGGYRPGTEDIVIAEHEAILQAFRAGDAEACGRAVFDHVTAARDRLMATLVLAKTGQLVLGDQG